MKEASHIRLAMRTRLENWEPSSLHFHFTSIWRSWNLVAVQFTSNHWFLSKQKYCHFRSLWLQTCAKIVKDWCSHRTEWGCPYDCGKNKLILEQSAEGFRKVKVGSLLRRGIVSHKSSLVAASSLYQWMSEWMPNRELLDSFCEETDTSQKWACVNCEASSRVAEPGGSAWT